MSSELRDLYQEVIVDHGKRPRNFRAIAPPAQVATGNNPLCGDRVQVYALVEDGVVRDLAFEGNGCAISTASASVMTQVLKGKSEAEARAVFDTFHALIVDGGAVDAAALGKLAVFAGVHEFPTRVKCAILAWHTMQAALRGGSDPVTTE
jgi:nitrogen fixation NifU-like protein